MNTNELINNTKQTGGYKKVKKINNKKINNKKVKKGRNNLIDIFKSLF